MGISQNYGPWVATRVRHPVLGAKLCHMFGSYVHDRGGNQEKPDILRLCRTNHVEVLWTWLNPAFGPVLSRKGTRRVPDCASAHVRVAHELLFEGRPSRKVNVEWLKVCGKRSRVLPHLKGSKTYSAKMPREGKSSLLEMSLPILQEVWAVLHHGTMSPYFSCPIPLKLYRPKHAALFWAAYL